MVKSLLKQILSDRPATKRLNAFLTANPQSKLHVAVIYASLDLRAPFPLAINHRLLWCVVADLLQFDRTPDLTLWNDDELPSVPQPSAQDKGYIPYELSPDDYTDQFSLLRHLYTVLHPSSTLIHPRPSSAKPWFDVYIGVDSTGCGSGGTFPLVGQRQSFMMHRTQSLPPAGTPVPELGRREVRAILDAATCWAHMWAGHAVRFHVRSAKLRDSLNDWRPSVSGGRAICTRCLNERPLVAWGVWPVDLAVHDRRRFNLIL